MKTRKRRNGAKHTARVNAVRKRRAKEGSDAVKKAQREAQGGSGQVQS